MLPPPHPVVAYLLALMLQAAPPARLAAGPQRPLHEEGAEARALRYRDLAEDLYRVAYAPDVPPLFREESGRGRAMTAALVLAVAYHESGFAHDVDRGPCFRGRAGGVDYRLRCDGGASACVMQIHVGDGTFMGWTRDELFADREKCFRAGVAKLRSSLSRCRSQPLSLRLTGYASGNSCTEPRGQRASRELDGQFRTFLRSAPLPGPDSAMMMPEADGP